MRATALELDSLFALIWARSFPLGQQMVTPLERERKGRWGPGAFA